MILTACIWAKVVTMPATLCADALSGAVISVVRIEENVIVFFFQKCIKVFYSQ